jgi:hypothetical protein
MRIDTHLILQIIVSLFSSIACSAAVYTFALFAPALRQSPHNLSESEISTIATFFVFATFINQPAGFLFDAVGPRRTVATGCVLTTLSWLLLSTFVFVDDKNTKLSLPTMTFIFTIAPFSASFNEVGGVLGNLKIFALQPAFVIMLQKLFIGLGASIVSASFAGFWAPHLFISTTITNSTDNSTKTSLVPTLLPYASFSNVLAIYSFITAAIVAFWIEWGDKSCPGLTTPPAVFGRLYKRLMMRGEYCLYVGIVLLIGGNLLVVWVGNESSSALLLRKVVAVVALLFPFSFFYMLLALPKQQELDDLKEKLESQQKTAGSSIREEEGDQNDNKFELVDQGTRMIRVGSKTNSTVESGDNKQNTNNNEETDDFELENLDFNQILKEIEKTKTNGPVIKEVMEIYEVLPPQNTSTLWENLKNHKVELFFWWLWCSCVWGSCTCIYSNSASIYRALPGMKDVEQDDTAKASVEGLEMLLMTSPDFRDFSPAIKNVFLNRYLPFEVSLNAIFVACVGTGNAIGRAIAAKVMPLLQSRRGSGAGLHVMLMVPPLATAIAAALLLVSEGTSLWLPFFITGCAIGYCWASLVLIVKEIFLYAGQVYSLLYTSGALTPFFFVMILYKGTYHYYEEQDQQEYQRLVNIVTALLNNTSAQTFLHDHHLSQLPSCHGVRCIAFPMVVCIILNLIAFCLSVELCKRIDRGCFATALKEQETRKSEIEEVVIKGNDGDE